MGYAQLYSDYPYYWHAYQHAENVWSPSLAIALLIVAVALHCVWRSWRGMRLDAFERSLRELRREPTGRLRVPPRPAPASRAGLLQISLLPLVLISSTAALLLAQAIRPDDTSRGVTWALLTLVGTWYSTSAWRDRRGVGPLRNYAFAGAASGAAISLGLWCFYMVVDAAHGSSYARMQSSFPTLLWWTAVGGSCGALLGALRANHIYNRVALESPGDEFEVSGLDSDETPAVTIEATPRRRRVAWGAVTMACLASLLVHLSAAPQVYRMIQVHCWYHWDARHSDSWSHQSLTLTMATTPARAPADLLANSIEITKAITTDRRLPADIGLGFMGMKQRVGNDKRTPMGDSIDDPETLTANVRYVAVRAIRKGEALQPHMFRVDRNPSIPVLGEIPSVSPIFRAATRERVQDLASVEGKVAQRAIAVGEVLNMSDAKPPAAVDSPVSGPARVGKKSGPVPTFEVKFATGLYPTLVEGEITGRSPTRQSGPVPKASARGGQAAKGEMAATSESTVTANKEELILGKRVDRIAETVVSASDAEASKTLPSSRSDATKYPVHDTFVPIKPLVSRESMNPSNGANDDRGAKAPVAVSRQPAPVEPSGSPRATERALLAAKAALRRDGYSVGYSVRSKTTKLPWTVARETQGGVANLPATFTIQSVREYSTIDSGVLSTPNSKRTVAMITSSGLVIFVEFIPTMLNESATIVRYSP